LKIKLKAIKQGIALSIIGIFFSLSVTAETEPNNTDIEDTGEVIVTIGKREQSINEVGITATAFDGEALSDLGIDNAVDLGAFTPGLITVNSMSGSNPVFAIRGIGLDDYNANNSSGVGVYTDEVFASSPAYLGGQLFDIERVEVLKGPQGTLYGKNTTGGAINFITTKPSDEFEAYIQADYSSYQTVDITSAVGGAISETVNGRLALNYVNSGEGWQQDINTGEEFGTQDKFAIRGQLSFKFTDKGDGLLRLYYSKDQSIPLTPQGEGLGNALFEPSFDVLNAPTDPSKVSVGNLDISRDESGSGIALTLKYSFDNYDLISITSSDQYERTLIDNYDGTAASITELSFDGKLKQWAQEIRLVSNSESNFSWIAGLNVGYEEVDAIVGLDDSFMVTNSVAIDFYLSDLADINASGLDLLDGDYIQETDSMGAYINTETQLNDNWKLTAGVRFSSDERSFNGIATQYSFGFPIPVSVFNDSQKDDKITGKIGLDVSINDDLLVYGNVATSYKGGVYYGAGIVQDTSWGYIAPEDIFSTELGFKWNLLDGAMHINGAIFSMDYEKRQSLVLYLVEGASNFLGVPILDATLATVPESESDGFEIDINWRPNENWIVQAGIANLETEITKVPSLSDLRGINPDPSVNYPAFGGQAPFVNALLAPIEAGTALSQSPEWSFNAMTAYEVEISSDYLLRLQASYSKIDEQFGALADLNALVDATTLVNALISIESLKLNNDWKLTLWGRNITDNDSETYAFSVIAGRSVYRQQPATYGVTLRYHF